MPDFQEELSNCKKSTASKLRRIIGNYTQTLPTLYPRRLAPSSAPPPESLIQFHVAQSRRCTGEWIWRSDGCEESNGGNILQCKARSSIITTSPSFLTFNFYLTINVTRFSETSVNLYQTTRRRITEEKAKFTPRKDHEGPHGEKTYSSTFSTSALDEGGWLTQRPGRFTPGNDAVAM